MRNQQKLISIKTNEASFYHLFSFSGRNSSEKSEIHYGKERQRKKKVPSIFLEKFFFELLPLESLSYSFIFSSFPPKHSLLMALTVENGKGENKKFVYNGKKRNFFFFFFASKWENLNNRKKEGTAKKRKKLMAKCARVVK